jgi:UDPglucose 6-dehydrogenase
VGQATGKGMIHAGHQVTFKDIQPEREQELFDSGHDVWSRCDQSQEWDLVFLSVGTPTREGSVDLTYLQSACDELGEILSSASNYPVVVLRCTVPPGTTEAMVIPALEKSSLKTAGQDFGVCYNPEFLRAVSAFEDFISPWLTVIGMHDKRSAEILREALEPITARNFTPVCVTDLRSAEVAKYASNLFNATKISFTNEIWSACKELEIDGDSVMSIVSHSAEGMWNPRYGTKGGFAYGGVCLPKDTAGFLGFARAQGIEMPLLEAVMTVNRRFEGEGGIE